MFVGGIVIMFCAFTKRPRIVRLHGTYADDSMESPGGDSAYESGLYDGGGIARESFVVPACPRIFASERLVLHDCRKRF